MAIQFRPLSRASAAALIGGLALSACGQVETETKTAAAETASAPAPSVSIAASLAPDALMLRALECRSSFAPLRHGTDLLPSDLMARVARTTDVSFGDLIFGAGRHGVSMEARRDAHQGGRRMPQSAADITPEYIHYVSTCADILDRAGAMLNEAKAAQS